MCFGCASARKTNALRQSHTAKANKARIAHEESATKKPNSLQNAQPKVLTMSTLKYMRTQGTDANAHRNSTTIVIQSGAINTIVLGCCVVTFPAEKIIVRTLSSNPLAPFQSL